MSSIYIQQSCSKEREKKKKTTFQKANKGVEAGYVNFIFKH